MNVKDSTREQSDSKHAKDIAHALPFVDVAIVSLKKKPVTHQPAEVVIENNFKFVMCAASNRDNVLPTGRSSGY